MNHSAGVFLFSIILLLAELKNGSGTERADFHSGPPPLAVRIEFSPPHIGPLLVWRSPAPNVHKIGVQIGNKTSSEWVSAQECRCPPSVGHPPTDHFCRPLKQIPNLVAIGFLLTNGTRIPTETADFSAFEGTICSSAPEQSGRHTANKSIEEMFHALQSEVGSLLKQVALLSSEEHDEGRFTRMANLLVSLGEVLLIWFGAPALAAFAALRARQQHGAAGGHDCGDGDGQRQEQQQQHDDLDLLLGDSHNTAGQTPLAF